MADLGTLVPASPLDSSNDSRLLFTNDTDNEVLSRALGDTPADFSSMDSLSWQVEYRQQGRSDDTLSLDIRIVNGATILAAANSGGTFQSVDSNVTNATDTTSSVTAFSYVNTTADKTTWDGASVELQQGYSQSKGKDGCRVEVDYVAITGTYSAGATDLLADDVQSTSEVTSPSVGQEHALTSTSVESASQVTTPAVGQEHALTATSVDSASEAGGTTSVDTYYSDTSVSGPTDTDAAWANDANAFDGSTSTGATGSFNGAKDSNDLVGSGHSGPASGNPITQVRARIYGGVFVSSSNTLYAEFFDGSTSLGRASIATDYLSPSWGAYTTLSAPSGGWTWTKLDSITCHLYGESSSGGLHKEARRVDVEVTTSTGPALTEVAALSANDVESASELTSPAIGQAHALTNPGVDSASELTAPAVTQEHALTATGTDSASETNAPAVGQVHALTATSVESASELTAPVLSEGAHALLADDVESVSELTTPAVGQAHALTNNGVESASETSSPAVGQEHALLSTGTDSASEVTSPAVTQVHALTSVSVESASQVSNPVLAEAGHALLADDVESASEVSSPAVGQAHALTVVSTDSASELTVPAVGQAHSLTATSVESASELTAPVLAEGTHDLLADDVESASEVTTPALGQEHALTVVSTESASEVSTPVLQSGVVSQPVTGGGWALPHHEKKKPAPQVVETVAEQWQPVEEKERARKTITLKKPASFEAEKTKALGIEADIIARRIDEEEARLLAAEIEALEAAIEQDRIDAQIIEFEKAAAEAAAQAAALKARQEEEEMMVMLLVASL